MRFVQHPRSPHRRPGNLLRTALIAIVGIAVIGAVLSSQAKKAQQDALAEADRLWPSKPADAVAKYKDGYPAESRKAEVLQKIVDHAAEQGNTDEMVKWVERGVADRVTVTYKSNGAQAALLRAERERAERETARKAAEVAKAAEQDAKAKERASKNRKYTREEFTALVVGRTKAEVIGLLGKPRATQQSGELELWDYPGRTTDPVTGKTDHNAQVEFQGEQCVGVDFIRV